jgi:hypothetical protein
MKRLVTYIRMSADLFNDLVIEMPRITQEIAGNVICMLDTFEDVRGDGELRPFPELGPLGLALEMDVLNPALMFSSSYL